MNKLIALGIISVIALSVYSTYYVENTYIPISINQRNYQTYINDINNPCPTRTNMSFSYDFNFCGKATIVFNDTTSHQYNMTLLQRHFWASCLFNCPYIVYRYDPTAIMTNGGHDFMFNCKDFGTSQSVFCTGTKGPRDNATIMMLSTSSTTPLVTDTGCGGGTGSGQITTGGLADALGTFTAGTPSAGTVTSTLAHTWTAAETDTSVQNQCVNTELHTGSHIILVYSFTFGPVTLVSGNTLAITDSLTAT